jgi:hypothetical protein
MPTADDLFRPTVVPDQPDDLSDAESADGAAVEQADEAKPTKRAPSGRVRHDEKMTVYVTADELLDIEHARLTLRRNGLTVDRGRLVRTAVAVALADLEANGEDSVIVQRLTKA